MDLAVLEIQALDKMNSPDENCSYEAIQEYIESPSFALDEVIRDGLSAALELDIEASTESLSRSTSFQLSLTEDGSLNSWASGSSAHGNHTVSTSDDSIHSSESQPAESGKSARRAFQLGSKHLATPLRMISVSSNEAKSEASVLSRRTAFTSTPMESLDMNRRTVSLGSNIKLPTSFGHKDDTSVHSSHQGICEDDAVSKLSSLLDFGDLLSKKSQDSIISECRPFANVNSRSNGFPEGYDPAVARILVEYSSAAYCRIHKDQTISECHCKKIGIPDFTLVKEVHNDKMFTHGYFGYSILKHALIIAFRGSASLKNWMKNMHIAKTKMEAFTPQNGQIPPKCMVHSGFLECYTSIREPLLESVVNFLKKNEGASDYVKYLLNLWKDVPGELEIYITGHSLGSALATLFALDLKLSYNIDSKGYTFGSPRVGNRAFAAYFNTQVMQFYRVVNNADIVPHMPLRKLGYYHVGTEIWYRSQVPARRDPKKKKSYIVEPIDLESDIPEQGCSSDVMTMYHLNVIDHRLYFDRLSGRRKLRGEKPPPSPVYVDNMIKVVAESFQDIVMRSRALVTVVVIRTFLCSVCKLTRNKFAKMAGWISQMNLENRILICTIDGMKNDVPDSYQHRTYPTVFIRSLKDSECPGRDEPIEVIEEWELTSLKLNPLLDLILQKAGIVVDPKEMISLDN